MLDEEGMDGEVFERGKVKEKGEGWIEKMQKQNVKQGSVNSSKTT